MEKEKSINTCTGDEFKGEIEKLKTSEVKKLKEDKNFEFDWSREVENDVYRIKREKEDETLGLMSISDFPHEKRIHIHLLEASKENVGKGKKFKNIAGNLIAFACKVAFKKGYDGFVSLLPKSKLVAHYMTYGFRKAGLFLAIFLKASADLISKYHNDE
ncbi:hypothetical protein [Aureispira anguillae]|uniref:Uncharacterized protein n=1 Tax=Aureispira anguillae TaxID=2864201 RepID=A0A915YLL4_9BACT|nr:hypothetical protein [Aureispira anguillae]BDS15172.1 hypothetical protein AsAng_0059560 [Aureispira anguillae]